MEETVIVIMLKNKETGFLESEIGSYNVGEYEQLIYNIYAGEEAGRVLVHMRLTVDKELADWEFSAVLDYYDTQTLEPACLSISEDDSGYDPVWEVVFEFEETQVDMEEKLLTILRLHKEELDSVYEAIKDLEAEYQ